MHACYVIKHLWLCSLRRTTWPGYTGTTMKLQIVLNTPKYLYFNQVSQKNTCQIFLPKSKVKSKKKTFNHPHDLEIRISPCPAGYVNRIILKLSLVSAFNTHCSPYPAGRVSFILPWKIYPASEQSLKSKLQHPLPVNPLDIWIFNKN